jgi:hypothetical protein
LAPSFDWSRDTVRAQICDSWCEFVLVLSMFHCYGLPPGSYCHPQLGVQPLSLPSYVPYEIPQAVPIPVPVAALPPRPASRPREPPTAGVEPPASRPQASSKRPRNRGPGARNGLDRIETFGYKLRAVEVGEKVGKPAAPLVEIWKRGASAQADAPAHQGASSRLNITFQPAEIANAAQICEAHGISPEPAPAKAMLDSLLYSAVHLSLSGAASPATMALLREYEGALKKSEATIRELERKLMDFGGDADSPRTYGASGPVSKEHQPLDDVEGSRGHSGQLKEKRGRGRNTWKYITMIMGGEQGAIRWFFHELARSMSSSRVPHEYQLFHGQVGVRG